MAGAATQLVEALPGDPAARPALQEPWQRPSRVDPSVVVDLLTSLSLIDPMLAERSVDHILAWPKTYDRDAVLIPAARILVGADTAQGTAAIDRLQAACVAHLRARIAEPLSPPADWQRTSTLPCHCHHCADLARFLADPERQTWALKAAEGVRSHVEDSIRRAGSDLDTTTDRRGRPFSLVCTKIRPATTGAPSNAGRISRICHGSRAEDSRPICINIPHDRSRRNFLVQGSCGMHEYAPGAIAYLCTCCFA